MTIAAQPTYSKTILKKLNHTDKYNCTGGQYYSKKKKACSCFLHATWNGTQCVCDAQYKLTTKKSKSGKTSHLRCAKLKANARVSSTVSYATSSSTVTLAITAPTGSVASANTGANNSVGAGGVANAADISSTSGTNNSSSSSAVSGASVAGLFVFQFSYNADICSHSFYECASCRAMCNTNNDGRSSANVFTNRDEIVEQDRQTPVYWRSKVQQQEENMYMFWSFHLEWNAMRL